MSRSIVFDANFDPDITCTTNIEYNPDTNAGDEWLTDPQEPAFALQRMRILKTRETGDEIIIPNTDGRVRVTPIDFSTYSYEELKMRRKATILQNKNMEPLTKNQSYTKLLRSKRASATTLRRIVESQKCETNRDVISKPASNAGIKGDMSALYMDTSIPFYSTI